MYKQVLQAVEKHHNHAVLVESALEVMIILSQNGGSVAPSPLTCSAEESRPCDKSLTNFTPPLYYN